MRNKLFNYPGAKTRVVDQIIAVFPKRYRNMCWVDAFGGSGIVTYSKDKSTLEVFNDLDEGISAIFYCLLFRYDALMYRLRDEASSELILKWIARDGHLDKESSILDKAISKLYQLQYSFGSKLFTPANKKNPEASALRPITKYPNTWRKWKKRFEQVQLMSRPAVKVIEKFDSKGMFVYCDPPYTVTEKGKHYSLNFKEEDHTELANTLKNIQGRFLLSYNKNPLIEELYPESDFFTQNLEVMYTMAKIEHVPHTELLIANYPLKKQKQLDGFLK